VKEVDKFSTGLDPQDFIEQFYDRLSVKIKKLKIAPIVISDKKTTALACLKV
jgi:hypothetical protein